MSVAETVRRVAGLETRIAVSVDPGPDITIRADRDQLEQLLINLVRNGVDAVLETGGAVTLSWISHPRLRRDHRHRRRPRHQRRHQPLRPLLHHQSRRLRHRPDTGAPDRRGARRDADAGQPPRPRARHHRPPAVTALIWSAEAAPPLSNSRGKSVAVAACGVKSAPKSVKSASNGVKSASKGVMSASKGAISAPKSVKSAPKGAKSAPKER